MPNGLTAAGQISLAEQLSIQTIEESLRPNRTDTILGVPYRRAIRNVEGHCQAAKALKAQPIQQSKLNLFARHLVKLFEYQNPNQDLSRKGRATPPARDHSRRPGLSQPSAGVGAER